MQLIIPAEAAHDTVYQLGEVRATAHGAAPRTPLSRCGAHHARRAHAHEARPVLPRLLAARRGQLRSRGPRTQRASNGGPMLGVRACALNRARWASAPRRPA